MDENHLLNLNPHRVMRCLSSILAENELDKIKEVLRDNLQQLFRLGRSHLRFAEKANGLMSWRQRVSRSYYSVYCISRAVRLAISGTFNTDTGDHKRIGDLPSDFPSKSRWEDLLTKFRADRNLADYDHTVSEEALEIDSKTYIKFADEFYHTAREYLIKKGAI